MTIKDKFFAMIEEKKQRKIEAGYNKYMAFATIASSEKYKEDASFIITRAKILETDVLNGKIKSRSLYDTLYFELAKDIKKLYEVKHEEEMNYIRFICVRGLSSEQQATAAVTHNQVNKYLEDNLKKAMTATRNCEFARMKKDLNYQGR